MTLGAVFSYSGGEFWLVLLALAGALGGFYISYVGFRMLRFKRMILNTPLSRIHSASIGLVEVTGTPVGPHTLTAPITGDPCFYYRVQAWQWVKLDNKHKWLPVLDESLYVPFFLEDGTGRVLVDPQSAQMDVHRNFTDEVSVSSFRTPDLLPEHLRDFLVKRGLVPSEKIKLDERIIPLGFPLFVFGTLGENTTMSSWQPRPQVRGVLPASFQLRSDGGTVTFRMSSKNNFLAERVLALTNSLSRIPGVHVETRITQFGSIPSSIPSPGLQARLTTAASMSHEKLSPDSSANTSVNGDAKSAEFDLHPSVCISKGERNELFAISSQSQKEMAGRLAWKSAACIWGGPVLALAFIYFLKIYFEWVL